MTHLPGGFDDIVVFLFGACIGSFLNVCIHRIPLSKSVVHPGSSCPRCGAAIRAYDNIPILSWIVLGGKCRRCQAPISIRYPMVEALTGAAAWGLYAKFGPTPTFGVLLLFVVALIVITFIDIDHQIIPNRISLPGIPVFFLLSYWIPQTTWLDALLGILVGGGVLYAVAWVYRLVKGTEGMGMGDVKLLAMIGAVIGWQGVLFTIFVSSAAGTLVGLGIVAATRSSLKSMLPFGPFLSLGAVVYLFFGPQIIDAYLRYVGV